MPLNIQVLVPHRNRSESLARHLKQWGDLGLVCNIADCDDEIFTRAVALNTAAEMATGADVLILTDVDMVLKRPEAALEAAELAMRDYCYVCTYSTMHALNQKGTRDLYAGREPGPDGMIEEVKLIWGAPAAVPRALWDEVGGMDPRFYGYGHEDLAFLAATDIFGGPKQRIEGVAWHMWHDENPYKNWNFQNASLTSRYRDSRSKDDVRAIIEERP